MGPWPKASRAGGTFAELLPAMVKGMFLVHARFEVLSLSEVPGDISELARSALTVADRVEHLSVHPVPPRHFVLGFYLLSDSLAQAEEWATTVCRRLLEDPSLPAARLLSVGVPLVAPLLSG